MGVGQRREPLPCDPCRVSTFTLAPSPSPLLHPHLPSFPSSPTPMLSHPQPLPFPLPSLSPSLSPSPSPRWVPAAAWTRRVPWSPSWTLPVRRRCAAQWPSQPAEGAARCVFVGVWACVCGGGGGGLIVLSGWGLERCMDGAGQGGKGVAFELLQARHHILWQLLRPGWAYLQLLQHLVQRTAWMLLYLAWCAQLPDCPTFCLVCVRQSPPHSLLPWV